jgi:hypothetical protein
MASAETPLQKQARIKTGVVARIEKEVCDANGRVQGGGSGPIVTFPHPPPPTPPPPCQLSGYHAELSKQRDKVAAMRTAGGDEHDIKKQVSMWARGRRWA